MATKIIDLDIYEAPDTDNPDGRLKDAVYTAADPPVLVTEGSEAKADYPVMDFATLGYKLIRNNGDTPSGTPDTQTASQIYDGLINEIKETAFYEEFVPTDVLYYLDGAGLHLKQLSTEASITSPEMIVHPKGITSAGTDGIGSVYYSRMGFWDISSASWVASLSDGWYSTTNITLYGYPSSSTDMVLHASIRWLIGSNWTTVPATVTVRDNGSGVMEVSYLHVNSGTVIPSAGTTQRLILTFEGQSLF